MLLMEGACTIHYLLTEEKGLYLVLVKAKVSLVMEGHLVGAETHLQACCELKGTLWGNSGGERLTAPMQ